MQLALKHRDPSHALGRTMPFKGPKRYTVLAQLEEGQRAEILLALVEDAGSLDQLVAIKVFPRDEPGTAPTELSSELELRSRLHHENIVRTSSIGFEGGRYFVVSEYLEGTPLRTLLRWSSLANERLPPAAVARILSAIVHAVEHAEQFAESAEDRSVIHQPVAADDVFITYDGRVKLLGFKSARNREVELRLVPEGGDDDPGARAAIDALLSSQLTPELSQVLASMANPSGAPPGDRLWRLRQTLDSWQTEELGVDGRAVLAAVMARVWPEARARQAARIEAAFAEASATRARSAQKLLPEDQVAPMSGYRARRFAASPPPDDLSDRVPSAEHPGELTEAGALMVVHPSRTGLPAAAVKPFRRRFVGISVMCLALAGGLLVYAGGRRGGPSTPGDGPLVVSTLEASVPASPSPRRAPPATAKVLSLPHESNRTSGEVVAVERAASKVARRTGPAPAPAKPVRAAPAAPAPGYLTLDTTPWSSVSLGRVSLGQTPLVKHELPAGEHLLQLENAELGLTSRYVVNIASGETTVRRVGLEQPKLH